MIAAEVIREAKAAGVRIAIDRGGLSLEASTTPPEAIINLIAQYKGEIIDLLGGGHDAAAETHVISWLDMTVAVENEADRHRIWRDELTRRAADDSLTPDERDTLERGIASHARDMAVFQAVLRVVEWARDEGFDSNGAEGV